MSRHQILWRFYSLWIRFVFLIQGKFWKIDPDFSKFGIKQGILPETEVRTFLKALKKAAQTTFDPTNFTAGYQSNSAASSYQEGLNQNYSYLLLGSEQQNCLRPLLSALRKPIMACMGSAWRVVNIRSWLTRIDAEKMGGNAWHSDGFPKSALKIMIYLAGASQEKGTTEIELKNGSKIFIEGPSGCWILFKNSELSHRGVSPKIGERTVVEVTIAPSLKNNQQPFFAGLNAQYPKIPWFKPNGSQGD